MHFDSDKSGEPLGVIIIIINSTAEVSSGGGARKPPSERATGLAWPGLTPSIAEFSYVRKCLAILHVLPVRMYPLVAPLLVV
jgi:hypothetical protein